MLKPCAALIVLAAISFDDAAAQAPRVRTTPITLRAIALAPAKPGAPVMVTSSDFESMGSLDRKFMQAVAGGENKSPAIAWSPGPAGTQSYTLFAEGEGETRADPTVHWIVYDIPATATSLPQGIPTDVDIANPAGAKNGLEDSVTGREDLSASPGYRGPNPPPGGRPSLLLSGLRARQEARAGSLRGQADTGHRGHEGTGSCVRRDHGQV
jgi:phosphatidylethanolamine-binding protein (PEBP) family uncharacterized protein